MTYSPPDYDPEADFVATGTVICGDCGARVRPKTLESLPPHGCDERRRHMERIRMLDAGQLPQNRNFPR
jgi:hypothetical protein